MAESGLFTTPEMAAVFSAEAHVRGMLAFEAALAHAEARAGEQACGTQVGTHGASDRVALSGLGVRGPTAKVLGPPPK